MLVKLSVLQEVTKMCVLQEEREEREVGEETEERREGCKVRYDKTLAHSLQLLFPAITSEGHKISANDGKLGGAWVRG